MLLSQLYGALFPFQLRTRRSKIRLIAVEKVLARDAAAIAHAFEYASCVEQVDRGVQLGYVAGIHHQDSVVSGIGQFHEQVSVDASTYPQIVFRRWAIHSSVLPLNPRTIVRWIFLSVSKSTEEVASSQTMICEPLTRARARARS